MRDGDLKGCDLWAEPAEALEAGVGGGALCLLKENNTMVIACICLTGRSWFSTEWPQIARLVKWFGSNRCALLRRVHWLGKRWLNMNKKSKLKRNMLLLVHALQNVGSLWHKKDLNKHCVVKMTTSLRDLCRHGYYNKHLFKGSGTIVVTVKRNQHWWGERETNSWLLFDNEFIYRGVTSTPGSPADQTDPADEGDVLMCGVGGQVKACGLN